MYVSCWNGAERAMMTNKPVKTVYFYLGCDYDESISAVIHCWDSTNHNEEQFYKILESYDAVYKSDGENADSVEITEFFTEEGYLQFMMTHAGHE